MPWSPSGDPGQDLGTGLVSPRQEKRNKGNIGVSDQSRKKGQFGDVSAAGIPCAADTMQEDEEDKADKDEEEEEEKEAIIEGGHPGSRATVGGLLIFC